jgi:protein TonB
MIVEQNMFLEDVYPAGKVKRSSALPAPEVTSQNRWLSEALLENNTTRQRRSPRDLAISFFIHFAIISLLLFLPLFVTQGIDMKHLETTLLIAPMPPMAAPPPPPAIARAVRAIPKVFTPGKLTAPTFIPKAVPVASVDAAPPEVAMAGMIGGVPGGVPDGQIGGITGGMPGIAAPAVAAPIAAEGPKHPVRIGGDVKAPRLIYGPAPMYPVLASQSRVHGVVVIDAIIDEHGNVVQEKVVSGHPLLVQAAMKAVSQRKYEPTILDGEPTPVDLRVEVNFQL